MRFGVVIGPGGGALAQMTRLFRLGLGGRLGSGRQWFSWIHARDLAAAALHLMQIDDFGVFNFTAPEPVRNIELTRALAEALHRPAILPAPAFAMKLVLGEFASVLLQGQRVVPSRLSQGGFGFQFPTSDQRSRTPWADRSGCQGLKGGGRWKN